MIFDLEKHVFVPEHSQTPGVGNFISYGRLIEQLRRAGEFRSDEVVTHLIFKSDGIDYRVKYV